MHMIFVVFTFSSYLLIILRLLFIAFFRTHIFFNCLPDVENAVRLDCDYFNVAEMLTHNNDMSAFQHDDRLQAKMATPLDDRNFQCNDCGRKYRYRHGLRYHQKYECGKDPTFKCEHCARMFYYPGNLKKHMIYKHSLLYFKN